MSWCSMSRWNFQSLNFPTLFCPYKSIFPLLDCSFAQWHFQDLNWLKYGARIFYFQCTFSQWVQINVEVYCPFREITDSKRNLSTPEIMCDPVWDPGKNQSWPQVPGPDKGRIGALRVKKLEKFSDGTKITWPDIISLFDAGGDENQCCHGKIRAGYQRFQNRWPPMMLRPPYE